ncbi:diguanylate cyclase [Aestuariibacter halophilus]|uniref:diguanylate cyclase n=1 Tax=Fluctibacter halophilus TaxID=226011 RepID=A0ABS8G7W9_9ALTE|nr:diguanylate cyclase [Aestuariibacter halophilus]MCC2616564.1 diguanylate cyclase [Aestuariibacter halophilus]
MLTSDALRRKVLNGFKNSTLLRSGVLALMWLMVWQLGRLVEYTDHASVWFPAAGLTYAALLIMGFSAVLPLMLAGTLITVWTGQYYELGMSLEQLLLAGGLFSVAHIAPYYLGASLVSWLARSNRLSLPQLIITFLVSTALVSLAATFLVLGVLIVTSMMPESALSSTWLPFWIGDMAGVIVLAPLFAALLALVHAKPNFRLDGYLGMRQYRPSREYKFKLLTVVTMIVASMLLADYSQAPESAFAIFFLAVPHMWIACSESAFFNTLSLAISSFLIALLVHVLGLMEYVMVYQFAINVVAANALFGVAVPALTADVRKLRRKVDTDSLTRTASREHMLLKAESEIHRSQTFDLPLSLVVFDIDHFKLINDQHGHSVGDDALKAVSDVARQCLRPSDMIGRFGGDEFVLLLPRTIEEDAEHIADRIRMGLEELKLNGLRISSSFGVAQLQRGDNFSGLFQRADRALYQAKKAGRNRVMSAMTDEAS